MKKIVVLTGSFNPISKGHRLIMESAIESLDADFGLLIITNDSYLTKKTMVDAKTPTSFHLSEATRKEMIDTLTASNPKIRYGGVELGGESPSTFKTLKALAKQYKDYRIFYMIGADKLKGIAHWTGFETLFDYFSLIVMPRNGFDIDTIIHNNSALSAHKENIKILDKVNEAEDVSSTLIRTKFFSHLDYQYLMDEGPYQILSQYSIEDFPSPTREEVMKATLLYGGRFSGNAARKLVYKANKQLLVDHYDISLFGDRDTFIHNTKVYQEEFKLPVNEHPEKTLYDCVNQNCVDVAEQLIKEGFNPCILNLASNVSPCGGYHEGYDGQEESLAYMSNLSLSLYQFGSEKYKRFREYQLVSKSGVYPMDIHFGGIYSKNVTFFRNNIDRFYSLKEKPFSVSVVTVSSLDHREKNKGNENEHQYFNPDGSLNESGKIVEKDKMRTIFRIALTNGHDSIVLGAFGCGCFRLLPDDVSILFQEVLEEKEFAHRFKKVIFAIYEGRGSSRKVVGENGTFAPFYQRFKKAIAK